MQKKKIAFVISSLSSGGAERVISNLSNQLIGKFEIVIITFEVSKPFYDLDRRIKVIHCLETCTPSTSIIEAIKLNYLLIMKIYQILKKQQVNLVIGFITSANILSIIASKFYGIPCIISERNNPLREGLPKFWKLLRKFIYPLADSVVLQTRGVKEIYKNKIKENKLMILPNPIASELTKLKDENVAREKLILSVGRLTENKNHVDIIHAFYSLNVIDWKLIIIGEGNKKQELTELIHRLNIADKVEIISKVKRIDVFYNKASIFLFASKTEGFPNALLEAMHFGLSCISTDCDFGPSDLIDDNINGYLIPINQTSILKERLSALINDDELRHRFSLKAKLTTEKYQSKEVIKHWERLINSFL